MRMYKYEFYAKPSPVLYNLFWAQTKRYFIPFNKGGATASQINSTGSIQDTSLPLDTVA